MVRPLKRPPEGWDNCAREIGVNLAKARTSKGFSQERVAHAAGIAAFTYYKFEKGESKPGTPLNPRLLTLLAICQALEVELREVLPSKYPDLTSGT